MNNILARGTVLFFYLLMIVITGTSFCTPKKHTLKVTATPTRVNRGESVKVEVQLNLDDVSKIKQIKAVYLTPNQGISELALKRTANRPDIYRGEISLDDQSSEGLYAIQAWTTDADYGPFVGKASFLIGKIVADFFIASIANTENPEQEIEQYLDSFRRVSGNFVIAHALIDREKSYYPSQICKNDIRTDSSKDIVGSLLNRCDELGIPVLLSVSWDLTGDTPSWDRMAEIQAIMNEMYGLYNHHPSFIGFYCYQEGSGTYFAPFIRNFCTHVKALNPGLLTACAPYVDDPLLAGYMSIIEPLDIIIFQGMVMASYRPDNRKKYPLKRVKDFCSVGIGAKWLQNKIALTHVEFFGYLENRQSKEYGTTGYDNIYPQILSAATAAGNDGISFFTYSTHIYQALKTFPEIGKSHKAVVNGMLAFNLIRGAIINDSNPLTLYYPYSDWVIERWYNYYLPALDAFRCLAIPIDFLPFAPPIVEDHPYYPFHKNDTLFARLIKDGKILVLPNVSGFHLTDSELIESFVAQGGIIIAFGPQIPMGNGYDRIDLFGFEEVNDKSQSSIYVKEAIGNQAQPGYHRSFQAVMLPVWQSKGAKIIATFADNNPAVLINHYGKGITVAIALDAKTAAIQAPELVRDIIDYTMAKHNTDRMVDIQGTNENVDVAVSKLDRGFRVTVVNQNEHSLEITLNALNIDQDAQFKWINLVTHEEIDSENNKKSLQFNLLAHRFICFEFRPNP